MADRPGTCQQIPGACITLFNSVCGCDGMTYADDCDRRQALVALDQAGACEPAGD
ncbi:MAG: hypothetical protein GY910_12700 [bacterium]|nr:hypothetical protein [bacterium]